MARLPIVAAREMLEEYDRAMDNGTAIYGPAVLPCVCGAPQWEHSGAGFTGKCKRTGCGRYRRDLAYALFEKALAGRAATLQDDLRRYDRETRQQREGERNEEREQGVWHIGASDALGDPEDPDQCRRKIMYREKGLPEGYREDSSDRRAAWLGGILQDALVAVGKYLYPWRRYEQVVHIDGLDGRSRYDDYDPITQTVNDNKTAGRWKWDKVGDNGPTLGNWEQVSMYALALTRDGNPVKTLRITYIARENGHDEVFERPYDEAFAIAAVNKLTAVATSLDHDVELPRDRSGPSTDRLCQLCEFRTACWQLDKADALGRSGESYVRLGPDPDQEAIEFTILRIVELRETATKAKNAHEAERPLITGIEPGVYGTAEITAGNAGKDNWKGYADKLREFYDLPDDQRPDADTIPVPKYPRTAPSASRLRKATRDRIEKERKAAEKAVAQARASLTVVPDAPEDDTEAVGQ
jgi:hypothetical protein